MRASHDLRAHLTLLTTNKMSGGQQLFGSNNLVVAGCEQENWASYHRQINRSSERCEAASCKLIVFIEPLNDLEIISTGEIERARVPFAEECDQPQAARRGDIIRNLQQAMNCFGFERWMFPELQQMRAEDASVAGSTNCLNTEVGTLRATRDSSDSPAFMSTGAPARTSPRILLGYRAA